MLQRCLWRIFATIPHGTSGGLWCSMGLNQWMLTWFVEKWSSPSLLLTLSLTTRALGTIWWGAYEWIEKMMTDYICVNILCRVNKELAAPLIKSRCLAMLEVVTHSNICCSCKHTYSHCCCMFPGNCRYRLSISIFALVNGTVLGRRSHCSVTATLCAAVHYVGGPAGPHSAQVLDDESRSGE